MDSHLELLVVIAIIGSSLDFCCLRSNKLAKRRGAMQCSNNLKQLGLALHNYHDTFKRFPGGSAFVPWMAMVPPQETVNLGRWTLEEGIPSGQASSRSSSRAPSSTPFLWT